MSNVTLNGTEYFSKIGKQINNTLHSREARTAVNEIYKEYINKHVPMDTGRLRETAVANSQSVTWTAPYAHYQFEGIVYAPNIPQIVDGAIISWDSRGAKTPTDRKLGVPGTLTEYYGQKLRVPWEFGYTTDDTTSKWTNTFISKYSQERAEANKKAVSIFKRFYKEKYGRAW